MLRLLIPVAAFIAYVIAALWRQRTQESEWLIEKTGGLPVALSHIYYGAPFGSIDAGIWDAALNSLAASTSGDAFLTKIAEGEFHSGGLMQTTVDGTGLGYSVFATASLWLFGPHTISLTLGFLVLFGASTLAFLARFRDNRALVVPTIFFALTLMLLTPFAAKPWIDQAPIGGYRFFVVLGVVPALHIILDLFDVTQDALMPRRIMLLVIQMMLLLLATSVRASANYLLAGIAFVAIVLIWLNRKDASRRGALLTRVIVLIAVGLVAHFAGKLLTPATYVADGVDSEVFWHRAFIGFGANPAWPFGDMATAMDCRPYIPEGLVPGIVDRDGHCAYFAALLQGAAPGALYGRQYETLLRSAFFQVLQQYPKEALETYLIYKPLMIWSTLSLGAELSFSRERALIMIVAAAQLLFILMMTYFARGDVGRVRDIAEAFTVVGAFSLIPPLFAWSTVHSSTDLICYMYVAPGLLLAVATRRIFSQADLQKRRKLS
jgi:hypothetical protein